jgi:threonine dehydratase
MFRKMKRKGTQIHRQKQITLRNRRTVMADNNKMTLDKFEEAYEDVKKVTLETKLIYSDYWSNLTGGKVYLKPENLQRTGAYKVRGAYYKITTLTDEERSKGLITASAGNHAQGVAYAAKQYGVKAVICMPTSTPLIKVNRTKALGAEVVLYGNVYDEAYEKALELAAEHGYTLVHPFDDLDVATGQGTIAMEIIKELPTVDVILVPIGGGGLATGVSTLAKLLNPKIKVIGVEPAGANCMQESFKAGHVVTLPSVNTIADGTAVKTPGEHIFPYIRENIDDIITVPDEDLVVSFLDMVENHKMVVENSGLLSVAALKQLNLKDKKVACVLSGGNMDIITMSSVVQQGLIMRDRIFTVSVLLPDKPGELSRVSGIIAEVKGNVIKLEHNQFVSINRNAAVELRITLEAFGTEHKEQIMSALNENGYKPRIVRTNI